MKYCRYAFAAALAAFLCSAALAQNTIYPPPLDQTYPLFTWDTAVYADGVHAFVLADQWGASSLDKVATTLKMNVTSDNFGYEWNPSANTFTRDTAGLLSSHLRQLYHLGAGHHNTSYLFWGAPFAGTSLPDLNGYWIGMRWEPAEHSDLESTWTPRDAEAWPFSFAVKSHGTITNTPSDSLYRYYVLRRDSAVTYPVIALDVAEPRNMLCLSGVKLQWNLFDPLNKPYETPNSDSVDGRRLQLVVTLRRTDAADTIMDDSVVVSLVVPYQERWKDQQVEHNLLRDSLTYRMPFDSIPCTSLADTVHLPLGRGTEMKMRAPLVFTDSLVITRRMLPLYSDPGGPDVTIVAEFRTDTIWDAEGERRPHILKSGAFDYGHGLDNDLDSAQQRKRYMTIDSLGVRLWYHGTATSVAVRSASLVTPQTKHATSGYWDLVWASELADLTAGFKTLQSELYGATGRTIKFLGFYVADEYDVIHLLGMRYRLEFFGRRLTSEAGYQGRRSYHGDLRTGLGLHKLYAFPTKYLWTAGLGQPERSVAVPYMGKYAPNYDEFGCSSCPEPPAATLGLKYGYRWYAPDSVVRPPYREYETHLQSNLFTGSAYDNVDLPLPTSPYDYTTTTAYEGILSPNIASVGPAVVAEAGLYEAFYQTGSWFFERRRNWWSNFFYHLDPSFLLDTMPRCRAPTCATTSSSP